MGYAILKITYPEPQSGGGVTYDQSQAMKKIRDIAKEQCRHGEDPETLGEYSWLLKLEIHLSILGRLVAVAESCGISYKIAYINCDLKWNDFDFD